jgi:hypothetical protein
MTEIIIQETTYDFLKSFENTLLQDDVFLDISCYTNGIEKENAVHWYFIAKINDEFAGCSALVKYFNVNDQTWKIYHRLSYTFPKFRKMGVWNALMEFKVKFCHENKINISNKTSHHVSCDLSDWRYRKTGWHLYNAKEIELKGKRIYQATWFLDWVELKQLYNIID